MAVETTNLSEEQILNRVYDDATNSLSVTSGGGGGGGGATTIADGADVALGAQADSAANTDNGTFSLIALTKRIAQRLTSLIALFKSSSATVTSQSDQATNATLLSANANRVGFRIYNDSTAVLYVKYGTTATSSDYTVQIAAGGYLEENYYTGRVDGIWASDASGAAKITEL